MSSNCADKIMDFEGYKNSATNPQLIYNEENSTVSGYLFQPHNKKIGKTSTEGECMNSDDILKAYMNKIDQDQRELKNEIREREERIIKNTSDSESRINSKLDRLENIIIEQNRIMDEKYEKMESKYDSTVKDIKGNKLAIWGICIATILSVAGICIGVMQCIQGIVSIIK